MSQIDEIKSKLDIVEIVGGYVSLTKSGRNYKGVCPFHSENSPSLMVSQELQIFKCFGCGKAGDIFAFIKEIEGVEFSEALKRLAEKAGVELKSDDYNKEDSRKKIIYEINKLTARFYNYLLMEHKIGVKGLEYLKDVRGLKDDTLNKFLLGYAPDTYDILFNFLTKKGYKVDDMVAAGVIVTSRFGSKYIDKFRGRITFPLTGIDGNILGFTARTLLNREPKYLNTNETAVFHKHLFVFALDIAKVGLKKEGAIIVEGQMDAITAHQHGFNNVVASSGTSLTKGHLDIISRYTKDVIFCFDSDTAGISAIHRSITLAEKDNFNIKVALIPAGYKDLDELIKDNIEEAKKMFINAIPVYDFYFVSALKRHDKNDPIGKKKIVEELVPVLAKITNTITLDHYVKKLSELLNLTESVVYEAVKHAPIHADSFGGAKTDLGQAVSSAQNMQNQQQNAQNVANSTENTPIPDGIFDKKANFSHYLLALMLKCDTDLLIEAVESLVERDFEDKQSRILFKKLADFVLEQKSFDITAFIAIMEPNLRDSLKEMYLWDFGEVTTSKESLSREIKAAIARVKKITIKRELNSITEKIKLAEMEKNPQLLKELLAEHTKLSQSLI